MAYFRDGYIAGRSYSYEAVPVEAFDNCYSLGFFMSSWDRRSVVAASLSGLRVSQAIVLRPASADPGGLEPQHYSELYAVLTASGSNVIELKVDLIDVHSSWNELVGRLASLTARFEGGLFVDLSACPSYYSVGLIAGLLRLGATSAIDVLYSEAEYVPNMSNLAEDSYPFSFGQWHSVSIPFLEGSPQPARPKFYLVSAGFEGPKTFRVLAKGDPDRVALLMPTPGYRPEYDAEVSAQNAAVIEHYRVPSRHILNSPAGDAISAWRTLTRSPLDTQGEEDVYYLCCGTKPHTLALALRALSLEYPAVVCNIPERHNEIDVRPSGKYWKYEIRDISAGFRRTGR